jgi:hypothetical protein
MVNVPALALAVVFYLSSATLAGVLIQDHFVRTGTLVAPFTEFGTKNGPTKLQLAVLAILS